MKVITKLSGNVSTVLETSLTQKLHLCEICLVLSSTFSHPDEFSVAVHLLCYFWEKISFAQEWFLLKPSWNRDNNRRKKRFFFFHCKASRLWDKLWAAHHPPTILISCFPADPVNVSTLVTLDESLACPYKDPLRHSLFPVWGLGGSIRPEKMEQPLAVLPNTIWKGAENLINSGLGLIMRQLVKMSSPCLQC